MITNYIQHKAISGNRGPSVCIEIDVSTTCKLLCLKKWGKFWIVVKISTCKKEEKLKPCLF